MIVQHAGYYDYYYLQLFIYDFSISNLLVAIWNVGPPMPATAHHVHDLLNANSFIYL